MKRAYIIHRWGGDSTSDWVPWLKEELEANGIAAVSPDMPNTDAPTITEWTSFLLSLIAAPDTDTYLIGHSVGCQAIVRYLAQLPDGTSVGKVILVAPWTELTKIKEESKETARQWVETQIDWDKARAHAKGFTVIYSDTDPLVSTDNAKYFAEKLGANLILEENRGHFTDGDDVTQLPVLLTEILSQE